MKPFTLREYAKAVKGIEYLRIGTEKYSEIWTDYSAYLDNFFSIHRWME